MTTQRLNLVLAVLVGLFTAVGFAADGDKDPNAAKKDAAAGNAGTSGVVDRVDAEKKTITLKGKKNNEAGITVVVNDATKLTQQEGKDTRPALFGDVAAGKNVVIVHETKDGKQIASSVTIVVPRPKK